MRLFVGVFPPPTFRQALAEISRELKIVEGAVLVRPENYHLTAAFLGEVDEGKVPLIKVRLGRISRDFNAFSLQPRRLELLQDGEVFVAAVVFRPSLEREKFCQEFVPAVSDLVKITKANLRPRTAHVTLFRARLSPSQREKIGRLFENLSRGLSDLRFPVQNFALVESTLTATGPVYSSLTTFNLSQKD